MDSLVDVGSCRSKLESLVHLTPLATIEWNLARQVVEWNPAAERVFEYSRREVLGHRFDDCPIAPGDSRQQSMATWDLVVGEGRYVHVMGENTTKSGRRIQCSWHLAPLFDALGRVTGVLSQAQDITAVKAYRHRLHALAFYDTLTGLPNRALFGDRIRQTLTRAGREAKLTGLMVLGLDRFKAVNDALGHSVGDQVLCEAATRLRNCVRAYDTVARFGGDEFVIIFPDIRAGADLGVIARNILDAFRPPFLCGDNRLVLSISIGIALHPDDSGNVDGLLRFAEAAMFHAKARGRGNFQFYSAELTSNAVERLDLEAGLRQVLDKNELEIHYQPQVSMAGGGVIGAEALLRWRHPSWGMIMPDRFIGIAEDTGLIVGIGEWVLRQACRAARKWNTRGRQLRIAVNLSPRQFGNGHLADSVAAILTDTGCRPEWIEFEITERLLLEDSHTVRKTLEAFAGMGIAIAIDDFGTGHSALAYIKRFAVSTLKIDRSFIHDVVVNPDSAELARAIISLAGSLRLRVVAEGVETEDQRAFLEASGCHVGQGYLYGKPMPACELEALI